MPRGPVGEELDQRRPGIGARPVRRPALGGVTGQSIVSVDPQPGEAVAQGPRREGRALTSGKT